jgi:hypothetical protein
MANAKISSLPDATTPLAGTEVLPIVQSSTTKKVSVDNLTTGKDVSVKTTNATGYSNISYVGGNGVSVTSANSGVVEQNTSSFSYPGTGTVNTLYGNLSAPQGDHTASSGTSALNIYGYGSFPSLISSASTSAFSLIGFNSTVQRTYAADSCSSTSTNLRGISLAYGHAATIPSTANTNNVLGIALTGAISSGNVGNRFSGFEATQSANPTTGTVSIGTLAGLYLNTNSIGTGAGSTTVTNYYGIRHTGFTNGANGTVTNAYELNLGGITNSGSITNKYAIYQADSSSTNYLASKLLIGTTTAGASKLVVNDDSIQVNTAKTPASASATGTAGQIAWDSSYIYVCVATNTWKRVAIATW